MIHEVFLAAGERQAIRLKNRHKVLMFLMTIIVNCSLLQTVVLSETFTSSYYITTEEFRWSNLSLKVYVDMNDWSRSDYALAAREALDNWVKSIRNYTQTYNDTSLPSVDYLFYVSDVNATPNYDVYLTFAPDNIPPNSNGVGLTTYSWNALTHNPISPMTINITTFSGTASKLFVKNVAMHEFGHVLGLGHAYPQTTSNGPELMYYASSKNQVVYPSTLDVYGLTMLYAGRFGQSVQLPDYVPYVMLAEGTISPPETNHWEYYRPYFPILGVLALIVVAAAVLGQLAKEKKRNEPLEHSPTQAPD